MRLCIAPCNYLRICYFVLIHTNLSKTLHKNFLAKNIFIYRIPIELFPIETQSKLLVAPTPVDFVEVVVDDKYVDTTSFRGSKKATTATTSTTTTTTEAPTTTTTESTIR